MKLPKTYQPNDYEEDIYALWEKSRVFEPKNRGSDGSYSIIMPPPNANANLHIGYELTAALEDIAVRYHRMKGEATLLLPGADHAGFETQVVYEKKLEKEGKSRFDFTREELYKQIWDFVATNRGNFETQLRRMGVSADWNRFTFTLDEKIVKLAYQTFKKMWNEGLIYRGERLVNFCTFHGTAFADIEVEHREEKGHLWYIRYPLTDGSGEVVVATTRPETMLGDTAVAVHPDDKRHSKFIGKTAKLPLTNREIPIVADKMVDLKFGTGAVKITPAHDQNDYDVAQRHDLPMITVIDNEGKMNNEAGEAYRGLTVSEARSKVVDNLKEQGFLAKTENHVHSVGHCYKCGTVIQPLLRDQWFIDMKPLAGPAIQALKDDKIKFYPAAKKDQLVTYLEGLRDWNISRQIAWGIPIPAFQNSDDPDDWIFDTRVGEEEIIVNGKTYRRDPDVFDTWFSSSSWPYATLDFPGGEDFRQFYPLSLMETGGEILYPWVSRMIMLGLYTTGKIPFEAVYIHGYVMAEDGAKMSKSIGNVVDPIPVIAQYGSDALRMGIIAGRSAAVNRGYDQRRVEEARNFANKLWNVARYVEDKIGDDFSAKNEPEPKTLSDYWILYKLQHLTDTISKDLDEYRFAEAYEKLYHLVWDDFADWYIEASKITANNGVLARGLETILKLAHPFAPFVTETIWQTLVTEKETMLAVSPWPEIKNGDQKKAAAFEEIMRIVSEARYFVNDMELQRARLTYRDSPLIAENTELIKRLARLASVEQAAEGDGFELVQTKQQVWLDVDEKTLEKYAVKLRAEIAELEKQKANLSKRLANKSYVQNAPKKVVEQSESQMKDNETALQKLLGQSKRLKD
jgi:valyl-tRNA synthetase